MVDPTALLAPPEGFVSATIMFVVGAATALLLAATFARLRRSRDLRRAQQDVEVIQHRLRSHLDSLPELIWIAGIDKKCVDFNRRWLEFRGRRLEEELGDGWSEGVHPADFDRCLATYTDSFDAREPFTMEYRLQRADGEYRWVLDSGVPTFDPAGEFEGYTGSCVDISERKAREEEIVQLTLAVENAMTGVSRLDREGRYVMVRERYASMLGWEAADLVGRSWEVSVPEAHRAIVTAAFERMLRDGRAEVDARGLRKDGSVFHKHLLMVLAHDELGQPDGHYCFMRDITDRKNAELELRLRDRAVTSAGEGVVIADVREPDSPAVYANDAFLRITGYELDEVLGRNCRFLQADDRDQPEIEEVRAAIREERETRVVLRNYRKDGSLFFNELALAPVRDEHDNVSHYVGLMNDITPRVRAEEGRAQLEEELRHSQKLEAMGTLASGVAHDFNNLLTAIRGYAELAECGLPEDHPSRANLELVSLTAKQASGVSQSLLTFAQKTAAKKCPIDLVQVVRDSVQILGRLLPASVEIDANLPEDEVWVRGDHVHIQQILINLAVNARDAMADGGTMTVRLHQSSSTSRDEVTLTVRDEGAGMTRETLERAFEPFYTTKPREHGTGLGLAIVHGIVQDHGGRVSLQSEPGSGTTVCVTFPTCEAPRTSVAPERGRAPVEDLEGRILLAEDNPQVQDVTRKFLQHAGFEVVTAWDGEEALQLFESLGPRIDLVVLDLELPKRHGLECLQEIRRMRPDVPVIIVSGNADRHIGRGSAFECETVLHKPYRMAEIVEAAAEAISSAKG